VDPRPLLDHQPGRTRVADPPDQRSQVAVARVEAHRQQQLAGVQQQVVVGVVDDQAGELDVDPARGDDEVEHAETQAVQHAAEGGHGLGHRHIVSRRGPPG